MSFCFAAWKRPIRNYLRRVEQAHSDALALAEDRDVTNQFNALASRKPGVVRLLTLLGVLATVDYAARHLVRPGRLGRIRTIHFARWVLLDGKRRGVFFSNYDGTVESYMDDFINKAGFGLNAIFCAAIGYPRTNWLVLRRMCGRAEVSEFPAPPHAALAGLVQGLSGPDGDRPGKESAHSRGPRVGVDERTGSPRLGRPPMNANELDYGDVQGLVRFGYGKMKEASYVHLRVRDAAAARAWLRDAPVTSAVAMTPLRQSRCRSLSRPPGLRRSVWRLRCWPASLRSF